MCDIIFTEWLQCLDQNWCHYWPGGSRSSAEQQEEFHYKQVSESWFTAAASCCRMFWWFHRFLPADCCVPPTDDRPLRQVGRGADTGLMAAQPLRAAGAEKAEGCRFNPRTTESGFLALWKKIWSSATGDDCACGADPTRIQPPPIPPSNSGSPGRPILHGALRRSDTKQLPSKKVPRFLPLLSLPQGKKRGGEELRVNFFPSEAKNNYQSWTFSQAFFEKLWALLQLSCRFMLPLPQNGQFLSKDLIIHITKRFPVVNTLFNSSISPCWNRSDLRLSGLNPLTLVKHLCLLVFFVHQLNW